MTARVGSESRFELSPYRFYCRPVLPIWRTEKIAATRPNSEPLEDKKLNICGGVGDILGDHGFPQAIAADDHAVAGFGEEVQGEGAFDQRAIDLLGPLPIEVSQGFKAAETGLSQAAFEAAAGQVFGFGAGDFFQQLTGRPALGGGAGEEIIR